MVLIGLADRHRHRACPSAVPAIARRRDGRLVAACSPTADYLSDIGISVARVWAAFLASAVIAIPLGILMSGYRAIGAVPEPLIDFVRYLPVPALVPLTLIWLGIGEGSKIALLWIGTFFQLVLLVADDARRVPKEFIETGRTLGATTAR